MYTKENNLISCLEETQNIIQRLQRRHNNSFGGELLFGYRGEPRDYKETKLMPSLFRNHEWAEKETHLFELFLDFKMIDSHVSSSNIEKAIEAQHYVAISRMLDISFNILAAIYFACNSKENEDEDGYVYIFAFPEHYSPHSRYIEEFYTNILQSKHPAYGKNFKVFSHSYANERIKAQSGGFIFFPGKEFSPISEVYYERIKIGKEQKNNILNQLELLFHMKEVTFFPEKENVAAEVKKKFFNGKYCERKVSIEDEVDAFCNRISYEVYILRKMAEHMHAKPILRKLRKEKSDIIQYIQYNLNDEELIEKMIKKVEENFNILRIDLKEQKND